MTEIIVNSENKRLWWGEGQWVDEPDVLEFVHNDIFCKIIRVAALDGPQEKVYIFGGHLCGYVCIPFGHQDYNKDIFSRDSYEYEVHGGLTMGELYDDGKFWIGFDCGHSGDLVPSMIDIKKFIKKNIMKKNHAIDFSKVAHFNPTYKTWDYVLEQVKHLADQVKERNQDT
jgi:hypothetical protein